MSALDRSYQILRRPLVTEKATDDSATRNAYHFRVPLDANKIEIRQAVERLFDVRVVSVNTSRVRGRYRRRGWTSGVTSAWKKAMVTLAEGQTIEMI
jgi:large subunit ribosomal protein L23